MEAFSTIIIISTIVYIIYEATLEEIDENIARRMLQFAPELSEEEKQRREEEDSSKFIRESLKKLAQNVADKSKNVLAQKQILTEAGMTSDDDTFIAHVSKKLAYAMVLGGVGIFLSTAGSFSPLNRLIILFILPLLGFRFPDMKMKSIGKKRAVEITYALPDAIDLLGVCVEAGLGLDSALTRVAKEQETSSPILSFEFKRVGKDVIAGISRADALKALAKRTASQELKSFIGLLVQSDKLGTSISQSLKVYADSMRVKRRQKAEELAAKASIKMTIPLVLFILPATFIVILAPAAISIMKTFSGSGL